MTNEREEFEKWWREQHKDVTKPITYFQAWQACAALKNKRIGLSDEDIEPIIGNYFGPIEYVSHDEIKRITLFAHAILSKARGE